MRQTWVCPVKAVFFWLSSQSSVLLAVRRDRSWPTPFTNTPHTCVTSKWKKEALQNLNGPPPLSDPLDRVGLCCRASDSSPVWAQTRLASKWKVIRDGGVTSLGTTVLSFGQWVLFSFCACLTVHTGRTQMTFVGVIKWNRPYCFSPKNVIKWKNLIERKMKPKTEDLRRGGKRTEREEFIIAQKHLKFIWDLTVSAWHVQLWLPRRQYSGLRVTGETHQAIFILMNVWRK